MEEMMVDRVPSLGVIVVHFGQPVLTLRCLKNLQNQSGIDLEVVLVDNSPQGDAPTFHDLGLRIRTLRCSNQGFAHANNQGLAQLRSAPVEGVLLLNNDAFALEGALSG
ncbi:MAG: glycosyltransferase, partial [Sphingobacteriia bacterium]|nr:glycosyltransferase [Sphingobacteriia bacterium]